jgi:signal-transduction protein with cAMP-binding, CBS, and nucleotidyltransferase domain
VSCELELTARDVMTRAVMCVAEGQPLIEAAHMMVHRDVDQIPVARDGRLIGVVTRAKVLRALHQRNAAAAHTKALS